MNFVKCLNIGLTGPTGAGKSTVSKVFAQNGFAVIDCDQLSRKAVEPGGAALKKLCESFGEDILSQSGELIRPLLAQRAFSSPEGRAKLNAAVHPAVLELTVEDIKKAHRCKKHTLIDAPLLFEAGFEKLCDICIAVTASPEIRLERICRRDSIGEEAALLRMSAQQPESFYIEKSDIVLDNNGTAQALADKASKLVAAIIKNPEAISDFRKTK